MGQDEKWMSLALREAERGKHKTWPNPWVGAIVVKGGKVVGRGFHAFAGGPHAEIDALNHAGGRARGATMYVTLEPCNHVGRTGPCTHAILRSGIKRVVAACPDPNPKADGGMEYLRRHGVTASLGVLREQAETLNQAFIRSAKLGRPWFILKAGASLDGRTATSTGESKWITSKAARNDAKRLRGACDAILVGAGTLLKDNPGLLPTRRGSAFVPWRVILDPRARARLTERVFKDRFAHRTLWITGPSLTGRRARKAASMGATVMRMKERVFRPFIREAVKAMAGLPLRRVLVEGGAQTLGAFLSAGLADELLLYMAPRIMGGDRSKGIFAGLNLKTLEAMPQLKELSVEKIGPDLKLRAYVHRDH